LSNTDDNDPSNNGKTTIPDVLRIFKLDMPRKAGHSAPSSHRLVLAYLRLRSFQQGYTCDSWEAIAKGCGLSRRKVEEVAKDLKEWGYLRTEVETFTSGRKIVILPEATNTETSEVYERGDVKAFKEAWGNRPGWSAQHAAAAAAQFPMKQDDLAKVISKLFENWPSVVSKLKSKKKTDHPTVKALATPSIAFTAKKWLKDERSRRSFSDF
jgi:biotin operon repressor